MKLLISILIIAQSFLFAQEAKQETKMTNSEANIKAQMLREQKYAKEQKFYMGDEYDLSGAEVDPKAVKHTPELEVDDLDMDDVYD